jgi:hypothetical protein
VGSDPSAAIRSLKQQPGPPLRSIGSLSLVKSRLRMGEVARLRLLIFPLILGATGREPLSTIFRISSWRSSHPTYSTRGSSRWNTACLDSRDSLITWLAGRPIGDDGARTR